MKVQSDELSRERLNICVAEMPSDRKRSFSVDQPNDLHPREHNWDPSDSIIDFVSAVTGQFDQTIQLFRW